MPDPTNDPTAGNATPPPAPSTPETPPVMPSTPSAPVNTSASTEPTPPAESLVMPTASAAAVPESPDKTIFDPVTPNETRQELADTPIASQPMATEQNIPQTGKKKISTLTLLVIGFILLAVIGVAIWLLTK